MFKLDFHPLYMFQFCILSDIMHALSIIHQVNFPLLRSLSIVFSGLHVIEIKMSPFVFVLFLLHDKEGETWSAW